MLTFSVVFWRGRDTANKYRWHVWGVLAVDGPHCVCHSPRRCVLPVSTLLRLQDALQGHTPKWALHFVHCPGQSHSGLGCSARAQTQIGCGFCVFPRSKLLKKLGEHTVAGGPCILCTSSVPATCFLGSLWGQNPRCPVCLLWEDDLRLWHSWHTWTVQDPRKTWLATGSLLTVWWKMQCLWPRLQQSLAF